MKQLDSQQRINKQAFLANLSKSEEFNDFFLVEIQNIGENALRVLKDTSSSLDEIRVAQGAYAVVEGVVQGFKDAPERFKKLKEKER